jgi:predicted phage terminase large subunit-like protein
MRIVQSWDVAMMTSGRNDYSACSTWLVHKNDAYLVHVYRGRLEYPDLRRKVIGLAAEHRATSVLIEDAGPGMNLLQDLRATMPGGMTRPIGLKPEGSKADRMAAQSAKIEAGHVYLPKSAAWLGEFLTELLSFPNGRHDDQVDSVSQFLRWLHGRVSKSDQLSCAVRRLQAEGISSSLEPIQGPRRGRASLCSPDTARTMPAGISTTKRSASCDT